MSNSERVYEFKDPATYLAMVQMALGAMIVLPISAVLLAFSGIADPDGGLLDLIGRASRIMSRVAPIIVLMWIYRANNNAHALGAEGMRFRPGWAVGWFFIPVFNLWKPYQAMAEIWKTSANPNDWQAEKPSLLLPWWWFTWILLVAMLSALIFVLVWLGAAEALNWVTVFSVLHLPVSVAVCGLFLVIATRISKMQIEQKNTELSRALA